MPHHRSRYFAWGCFSDFWDAAPWRAAIDQAKFAGALFSPDGARRCFAEGATSECV
jgi:hypothetical protein